MAGDVDDHKSNHGMIYFLLIIRAIIGADRKRRQSTNTIRGQQGYDLLDQKPSFAQPEQAHRDQIPLHLEVCRSGTYQD